MKEKVREVARGQFRNLSKMNTIHTTTGQEDIMKIKN